MFEDLRKGYRLIAAGSLDQAVGLFGLSLLGKRPLCASKVIQLNKGSEISDNYAAYGWREVFEREGIREGEYIQFISPIGDSKGTTIETTYYNEPGRPVSYSTRVITPESTNKVSGPPGRNYGHQQAVDQAGSAAPKPGTITQKDVDNFGDY